MSAPSSPQGAALEHLRIIRTLMERAHIYRSVSAPAALIGGVLAVIVAGLGVKLNMTPEGNYAVDENCGSRQFLFTWLGVLVVSGVANLLLLMRESGHKGQPAITEGMRMALRAIVPPLLTGGVLGVCLIWFQKNVELAALVWILCYGLALQATVSFAPRGIIRLARAFLITGQALTILWFWTRGLGTTLGPEAVASLMMGVTFGLYHVVYGAAVFASGSAANDEVRMTNAET
jgi:hypothetical protein